MRTEDVGVDVTGIISVENYSTAITALEIKTSIDLGVELDVIKSVNIPDFVIFWDKDIYLGNKLENLGIRLFNTPRSVLLCDDKILMYQELKKHGIKIPRTYVAPKTYLPLNDEHTRFIEEVAKEIGFPMVIKEAFGSFGKQVYLANNIDEAKTIAKNIGVTPFLIQEFIYSSKGRDVRINMVGGKVIASMLRENPLDFRSNISNGGSGIKYEPNEKFIKIAEETFKALNMDFAGIDVMFLENDEPIICEVNSNPQFASTLRATGINLADYIRDYILEALK